MLEIALIVGRVVEVNLVMPLADFAWLAMLAAIGCRVGKQRA